MNENHNEHSSSEKQNTEQNTFENDQRSQAKNTFWGNFPFGWAKTRCIEWERRATVTIKYQAVLLALTAWTLLLGAALAIVLLRTAPTAENMVNLIINDPVQHERLALEVISALKKLDAEGKLQKQNSVQPKAEKE